VEFLLVLLALVAVVYIVSGPLRRPGAGDRSSGTAPRDRVERHGSPARGGAATRVSSLAGGFARENELSELEAAREAKYREIRDTQLDYDTGKLSAEDFESLDSGLRRQALEILERIDRLAPPGPRPARPGSAETGLGEPE
jgi:hypothetical protein